jgi:hypothetical protein
VRLGPAGDGGSTELPSSTVEIASSRAAHLWDALEHAYRVLGFAGVTDDEVFRDLVLARIIGPSSKADAARVLGLPDSHHPQGLSRLRC